jgi:hypothetical protein
MNPYLEHPTVWSTFHTQALTAMAERLAAQVRPDYLVHMEAHIWIHELVEDLDDPALKRRLIGRSDVALSEREIDAKARLSGSETETALLAPPVRISIPRVDIERQRYLEMRDRRNRELVAVVELLSPANKVPAPDREQYLGKRAEILASRAHLVEIDLLRCGLPMPDHERPSSTYGVMVSHAEERPAAGFWPIGFREPLPRIPVPLRGASRATMDLQEILHHVYDHGTYADEIYDVEPVPPLDVADLAWAREIVTGAAFRGSSIDRGS